MSRVLLPAAPWRNRRTLNIARLSYAQTCQARKRSVRAVKTPFIIVDLAHDVCADVLISGRTTVWFQHQCTPLRQSMRQPLTLQNPKTVPSALTFRTPYVGVGGAGLACCCCRCAFAEGKGYV